MASRHFHLTRLYVFGSEFANGVVSRRLRH